MPATTRVYHEYSGIRLILILGGRQFITPTGAKEPSNGSKPSNGSQTLDKGK